MKKLTLTFFGFIILGLVVSTFSGCKKKFEVYPQDPNVAGENDPVPPSFLLRRILFEVYRGGGVVDNRPGNVPEEPWQYVSRVNQYQTGLTFPLYGGSNEMNWTVTADNYNQIKNIAQMEKFATTSYGAENNGYLAMAKFLRAYTFIWYTQRVGDIPMSQAGKGDEFLTPEFDTQEQVYEACLKLLEEANDDFANIIAAGANGTRIDGDIYFNNNMATWQKVVNAFKLRVLISLSKRADDTPALRIKERFAETIGDPAKYPLMASNADQLAFNFRAQFNRYPSQFRALYSDQTTMTSTYLNITTATLDPRTFIAATPAPAELEAGKDFTDFTAYVGTENGRPQGILNSEAQTGKYSYPNYLRYFKNTIDNAPEPYIMIGYAEQCFNIAEAINRGWVTGDAATHYTNGINASMSFYDISNGSTIAVGNSNGSETYGQVTVDLDAFLTHPDVVYKGGADGLEQILTQKYVAMFQNSGWEPFYTYRRTGVPAFSEGPGTNTRGKIPMRWRYPANEAENNPNAGPAIQRQFGSDDVDGIMWLLK